MGLVRKNTPVGIDKIIDRLQVKMFEKLIAIWGIASDRYNCTPRCYRNKSEDGYIAELFYGGLANGKDYEELYINDKVSVTSFFGVGQEEQVTQDNMTTANVHLIFSCNVVELKPLPAGQRNDEEVRLDVQKFLDSTGTAQGWLLTKVTSGLDKILSEYPGNRKDVGLKFKDMHPNLWFRFDLQIFYQPTQKNCGISI